MENETVIRSDINSRVYTDVFRRLWRQSKGKRYVINYGGSGSSKSHSQAQLEVIKRLNEPGISVVGRKVARTHKDSTVALITTVLRDMGILNRDVYFKKYDREFQFTNGSKMVFVGLDDIEKLKSIHRPQRFWYEEATEGDEDEFMEIDRRLRGVHDIQLSLTFNPIDIEHWIKKVFWDTPYFADHNKTAIIKSTYQDNHYLLDEDRAKAESMKEYNENDYRIYALGEWGQLKTGHEFYFKFSLKDHVLESEYSPALPLHLSFDFNVVPYIYCSAWQMHRVGDAIYCKCFDEFALETPKNNTYDLCEAVKQRYGRHKNGVYVYGDATGRARSTQSKDHNYDIIFRSLSSLLSNYSDRVPRANPAVTKRREFVNRCLHGSFPFKIHVSRACKKMVEDLTRVKEDAEGGKLKTKASEQGISFERWGHASDTLDYFLCSAFEDHFNNF
jgi:hypothetical protein